MFCKNAFLALQVNAVSADDPSLLTFEQQDHVLFFKFNFLF